MDSSIYKVNDIRGVYPTEISENDAHVIGRAAAHFLPAGKIIFAHDGRLSSPALYDALLRGFAVGGREAKKDFIVEKVGGATTPMLYYLVENLHATGGLMITASHNPKEYNGVKVVDHTGLPISGDEVGKWVLRLKQEHGV